MRSRLFFSVATLGLMYAAWASHFFAADEPAPKTNSAESSELFEKQIQPLLVKTCGKCHGKQPKNNDLDLVSFGTAKAILDTRPIFHQRDATIAGHLFCSFLALVLRKALDECLEVAGVVAEWADIVRDLDRLEEVTIDQGDKRFVLRLQAQGCAGAVCKAVGIALPPLVRQLPAARPPPAADPPPKPHRGRPLRGATPPVFS